MKIYLATDHAGFALKEVVKAFLVGEEYEVEDCGAFSFDKQDDWSDIIPKAAEKISANPFDRAIIFGGSGQGEMIIANKFLHVRAALFYGTKLLTHEADATGRVSSDPYEIVKLTRTHNNANMLSIGARLVTDEEAIEAVRIFLTTDFSKEERHVRRLKHLAKLEKLLHE